MLQFEKLPKHIYFKIFFRNIIENLMKFTKKLFRKNIYYILKLEDHFKHNLWYLQSYFAPKIKGINPDLDQIIFNVTDPRRWSI